MPNYLRLTEYALEAAEQNGNLLKKFLPVDDALAEARALGILPTSTHPGRVPWATFGDLHSVQAAGAEKIPFHEFMGKVTRLSSRKNAELAENPSGIEDSGFYHQFLQKLALQSDKSYETAWLNETRKVNPVSIFNHSRKSGSDGVRFYTAVQFDR